LAAAKIARETNLVDLVFGSVAKFRRVFKRTAEHDFGRRENCTRNESCRSCFLFGGWEAGKDLAEIRQDSRQTPYGVNSEEKQPLTEHNEHYRTLVVGLSCRPPRGIVVGVSLDSCTSFDRHQSPFDD